MIASVHSVAVDSTIVFARPWKACSTFSPVFADVYITGHSYDARTVDASSVFTSRRCVRSVLFPRAYTGTGPTESRTPSIHLVRSRSDCARVMSKTARTPLAPWKYASLKSWRNVRLPMMSKIIMSTWTGRPCIDPRATVFFDTTAPSVRMYDSSNAPDTNRWMRLVLPTPSSPTRQILNLKVLDSGSIAGLRSMVGRDTLPGGYQAVGPIFRFGNAPARILRCRRSSPSARSAA